ncbi:MAG: hypothetical protein K2M31_07770 [Muribaculaceae bacterium]|nr:hypothetical protein [Muribaculaceae bacterium]
MAEEYASKNVRIEFIKDVLKMAYFAGAANALSGQWRSPETISQCKGERVLVVYMAEYNGKILKITTINEADEWNDPTCNEHHKNDDLIAWMEIPDLPEDLAVNI